MKKTPEEQEHEEAYDILDSLHINLYHQYSIF